jgi:hypothetical protein
VTWSPGDVDIGIQSLLVQFYPILLSTLLSTNGTQLSRFDAGFALLLSSSPLTIYLVFASICDLFGIHTGLYKRIKSHRLIIRTLGVLVMFLWTGLSMTLSLSTGAFKDSSCGVSTFASWLQGTIFWLVISFFVHGDLTYRTLLFTLAIVIPWLFCLVRRWSQLRVDVKLYSEGASRLRKSWTLMKYTWYVPVHVGPRLPKSNTIKVHY